jgi:osmotically-inducible protein OsmY
MISKQSKDRKKRSHSGPRSEPAVDENFDETSVDHEVNLHAPQTDDYETMEPLSGGNEASEETRRPDDTILENVSYMLTRHTEIDNENINIRIDKGEVILTGSVPEERMKFMATEVIKLIPGVKSVNNQLKYVRIQ